MHYNFDFGFIQRVALMWVSVSPSTVTVSLSWKVLARHWSSIWVYSTDKYTLNILYSEPQRRAEKASSGNRYYIETKIKSVLIWISKPLFYPLLLIFTRGQFFPFGYCRCLHLSVYCSTVLPLVLGVVTRQKPQINGSVVLGADESPWPCGTPSWYTPLSWMILSKQKNLRLFSSLYNCVFL